MFLYARMQEAKVYELKPTSSIADPQSPRESDSIASMTPTGEYGRARGFFRDQPLSTTNRSGGIFNLSTPKGQSQALNDFKVGVNIPQTPKIDGNSQFNFNQALDDISEKDEETEERVNRNDQEPRRASKRLISPQA